MAAIIQNRRLPPPWKGPPFTPVVANTRQPLEQPQTFPFDDAKVSNPNLFPPVCLRSHWDPEKIIKLTLPMSCAPITSPLDPRPWTKVCMKYTTSADFEEAPRPPDNVVFPSGGQNYPPTRYIESIDKESLLRRLDRPLGICERAQYFPPESGTMYSPNSTVPYRGPQNDRFIQELSFPKACMRTSDYDCRSEAELEAWHRSARMFNNTTKQDRYAVSRPDLATPTDDNSIRAGTNVQGV